MSSSTENFSKEELDKLAVENFKGFLRFPTISADGPKMDHMLVVLII